MSREQIPSSVFCFCSFAIRGYRETGNQGDEGLNPTLMFIELKASGMTGITNSANHAAYLFSMCIKMWLSVLTLFTKGELRSLFKECLSLSIGTHQCITKTMGLNPFAMPWGVGC